MALCPKSAKLEEMSLVRWPRTASAGSAGWFRHPCLSDPSLSRRTVLRALQAIRNGRVVITTTERALMCAPPAITTA